MSDNVSRASSLEGGALGGPMIVVLGYAVGRAAGLMWDDWMLVALLLLPVVLAAPFLLVASRRPDAVRFIVGALLGIAVLVGVIVGGISLIAGMLSDPA